MELQPQAPHQAPRSELDALLAEIAALEQELARIQSQTEAFENQLAAHLIDQIVEEQELSVLYKQLQKAKKEKRREQKMRANPNKQFPQKSPKSSSPSDNTDSPDQQRERKRLYREAMLRIHPDKCGLHSEALELATQATTHLIELYQNGTLSELADYHQHILAGHALAGYSPTPSAVSVSVRDNPYLQKRKQQLLQQLQAARQHHTYIVLCTYPDPMSYLGTLQEFYADRLAKLRKRTRKARK